ncbi:MAG: glucose-1-phosphate adenylyltransferase subunit GlgD [Oscillospiraceae bacterium]|nr:glucose-1-phosphate adenylyltransferase subunit GlgD [Oscillospiraceae bacterium]
MNGLHGIIFSYEKEPGLRELVEHRMPASIPFGGRYRIIDFMLSNMQNAGVTDVGIVLHGNYQSLLDHVGNGKTWDMSRKHGGLRILPPFADNRKYRSGEEFEGKMQALAGVRSYLEQIRQDYVVVADSDLIINIDIDEVYKAHLASGADITCVCTANYKKTEEATFFLLGDDNKVVKTLCSPKKPEGYHCLEIYILSKELLLKLVDTCEAEEKVSFRSDVLNGMGDQLDIRAFVFDGMAAQIRTVKEYYDRSIDALNPRIYRALSTPERPIRAKEDDETPTYLAPESRCVNALIADGCEIAGSVENSIIFPGVRIAKGASVRNSVLFKGTVIEENASISYVIADKNVTIRRGGKLTGHESYPMVISKGSTI